MAFGESRSDADKLTNDPDSVSFESSGKTSGWSESVG